MKRLGCLLLALAMLLTLAPALRTTANAAGVITGSRGSSEWSLDTDTGKLTISLTGTSPRWAEAVGYDYLNTLKEQVKSVVFVGNYTEIGHGSFRDFSNLSSVEIPDTVTAIGGHAFSGCALRSLPTGRACTAAREARPAITPPPPEQRTSCRMLSKAAPAFWA